MEGVEVPHAEGRRLRRSYGTSRGHDCPSNGPGCPRRLGTRRRSRDELPRRQTLRLARRPTSRSLDGRSLDLALLSLRAERTRIDPVDSCRTSFLEGQESRRHGQVPRRARRGPFAGARSRLCTRPRRRSRSDRRPDQEGIEPPLRLFRLHPQRSSAYRGLEGLGGRLPD